MDADGLRIVERSPWYSTAPWPPSEQPRFVNAVARIATALTPLEVLERLLAIEAALGRTRGERWAARTVDLDLLAYGDRVVDLAPAGGRPGLVLPHPRLHERAFVLRPLADLAPQWRHPGSGRTVGELLAGAPDADQVKPLGEP